MNDYTGGLWVIMISFLFLSCQSEVNETIGEDPDAVITPGSEMAMWLQRATANNGSSDDFMDGYSCGTVKLPVAITLNGAVRMVNNQSELKTVKRIVEQLDMPVTLQYPVTIITGDYTEVTVNSEAELEVLRQACGSNPEGRIACVSFQYPVEMLVYNANNQSNGSVTINDDREFYLFIKEIGNLHTSISYPVKLDFTTGGKININSNSGLITAIRQAGEVCRPDGG
ncbi:hypothetical protein [Sinomicrobium weinanense]|uniref:Uncharacterized protein n=1 Tax=Sinomicrobium weinanense TaxID=2842200 RepID=A0A926JQQ3_9FLAO|nr:hypothetical protein [Sinomicrobium weinanense]MBC9795619.1 hypothetical protein [Sinomicrobium weinanense]MBU3124640.1 hypothetical protein [Sinomicrobium weinanense]